MNLGEQELLNKHKNLLSRFFAIDNITQLLNEGDYPAIYDSWFSYLERTGNSSVNDGVLTILFKNSSLA